jgi:hypothetical protein
MSSRAAETNAGQRLGRETVSQVILSRRGASLCRPSINSMFLVIPCTIARSLTLSISLSSPSRGPTTRSNRHEPLKAGRTTPRERYVKSISHLHILAITFSAHFSFLNRQPSIPLTPSTRLTLDKQCPTESRSVHEAYILLSSTCRSGPSL